MKSKIGPLLFSGAFALAFGIGGFFAGLLPFTQMMREAWKAQSYVPVPAQVLEVSLDSGGENTHAVRARYRYEIDGKVHESSRIGLAEQGADNIGDWHHRWHARLQNARKNNQPVTAWVDPRQPHEAVIDKELRWPRVFFLIPFATLFPAVGLGAFWIFIKTLTASPDEIGRPAKEIRTGQRKTGVLSDGSTSRTRGLWMFSIFWNLFCWPIVIAAWSTLGWSPVLFFIALFPLTGLLLLWAAISASAKARRCSGTEVSTWPTEPRVGEDMSVDITLPASRLNSDWQQQFELRISENRIRENDSSPTPNTIWTNLQKPAVLPLASGDGNIKVQFHIPEHCEPADRIIDGERVVWFLELIDLSNSDVQRFQLAVLPGNAPATGRASSRTAITDKAVARWHSAGESAGCTPVPIPASVMRVTERNGKWTAAFSCTGARLAGAFWLFPAGGAFWMARQSFLGHTSMDVVWAIVWLLAAGIGTGLCLHYFSKTWKLVITQHGVELQRDSLLWSNRSLLANGDMVELVKNSAYQLRSASEMRSYFQIYAVTRNGKRIQLTPGIAWDSIADAVADKISTARKSYAQLFSPLQTESSAATSRRVLGLVLYALLILVGTGAVSLHSTYRPGDPIDVSRIAQDWEIRLERLSPASWM